MIQFRKYCQLAFYRFIGKLIILPSFNLGRSTLTFPLIIELIRA